MGLCLPTCYLYLIIVINIPVCIVNGKDNIYLNASILKWYQVGLGTLNIGKCMCLSIVSYEVLWTGTELRLKEYKCQRYF